MEIINLDQWIAIFNCVAESIAINEEYLNKLDSMIGDGDHGTSINRGFESVKAKIRDSTFTSVDELFSKVGSVLFQEVGGAIGPLIGTFFMTMGKTVQDRKEINLTLWTLMFSEGVDHIRNLGKAQLGDKTIIDALQPALVSLKEASCQGLSLELAFRNAALAARMGADQTSSMVAKFGRAKFVGPRSLSHQDPGANSIWIILNTMAEVLIQMAS